MRSANQSPQSLGSSGMDSGVDSFSDQSGELPSIAISLCGGLTEDRDITRGKQLFVQYQTVQLFLEELIALSIEDKVGLQMNVFVQQSLYFSSTEEFEEKAVTYQEFANNPSIIDDPSLVVKIGAKYDDYFSE